MGGKAFAGAEGGAGWSQAVYTLWRSPARRRRGATALGGDTLERSRQNFRQAVEKANPLFYLQPYARLRRCVPARPELLETPVVFAASPRFADAVNVK
jgi:hypothetical protein